MAQIKMQYGGIKTDRIIKDVYVDNNIVKVPLVNNFEPYPPSSYGNSITFNDNKMTWNKSHTSGSGFGNNAIQSIIGYIPNGIYKKIEFDVTISTNYSYSVGYDFSVYFYNNGIAVDHLSTSITAINTDINFDGVIALNDINTTNGTLSFYFFKQSSSNWTASDKFNITIHKLILYRKG